VDFNQLLLTLQDKSKKSGRSSCSERRRKIKRLEKVVYRRRDEIRIAMASDFGKPRLEVDYTETFVVLAEARHARKNLKNWLAPQPVPTPLSLLGNRSEIRLESKGVVLIIAPWNFPFNLSLIPVISAVAAGNTVLLKPSEHATYSAILLESILNEAFPSGEVVVVQGGADVSKELTELPVDHIFFTGSTKVGQMVMTAAAKRLTSLTLELGGKSPVYVDKSVNVKAAAKSISWGRLFNAGQTCVAPDYALVHEEVAEHFIAHLIDENSKYSSEHQGVMSKIAHDDHLQQMGSFIEDAQGKCDRIIGGKIDSATRSCSPTIVVNPSDNTKVAREEIFGPILVLYIVKSLDDALRKINSHERPLSLYIFSKSRQVQERIIAETRAGSTVINETVVQFNNSNLPFGGSGKSGFGKTHGHHGFLEFTNQRAIMKKVLPITTSLLVFPPYTKFKERVAEIVMRWF
jgi:aldehyde dehydrogenase (NAD+)